MELNGTTSSGLPVVYSLPSGNDKADLNGSTLGFLATGAATLEIIQSGNGNYLPAAPIVINFQIGKAELMITAHNQFRKIGFANPALTYDVTGFVNGENNSALIEQPICNTTALITSPAVLIPDPRVPLMPAHPLGDLL